MIIHLHYGLNREMNKAYLGEPLQYFKDNLIGIPQEQLLTIEPTVHLKLYRGASSSVIINPPRTDGLLIIVDTCTC